MPDRDANNDIGGRSKKAFLGVRCIFLMLLASLCFRPGRCGRSADPNDLEVDGSDPLFLTLVRGRGAPVHRRPCRKAVEPAKKPELGTAEPSNGVRRPQLTHWPRRHTEDRAHNRQSPTLSTGRLLAA